MDTKPPSSPTISPPRQQAARKNKLGYTRSSIACAHCRRRKIRCIPYDADPQKRCRNCSKLNRECIFKTDDSRNSQTPEKPMSNTPPSTTRSPSVAYYNQYNHIDMPYSMPVVFPGFHNQDSSFGAGRMMLNPGHFLNSTSDPPDMSSMNTTSLPDTIAYDTVPQGTWQPQQAGGDATHGWPSSEVHVPFGDPWTSSRVNYQQGPSNVTIAPNAYQAGSVDQMRGRMQPQHQYVVQQPIFNMMTMDHPQQGQPSFPPPGSYGNISQLHVVPSTTPPVVPSQTSAAPYNDAGHAPHPMANQHQQSPGIPTNARRDSKQTAVGVQQQMRLARLQGRATHMKGEQWHPY